MECLQGFDETATLAGYFVSQAIAWVHHQPDEDLDPIGGSEDADGDVGLTIFLDPAGGDPAAQGRAWLDRNGADAVRAVFVRAGWITVGAQRADCLIATAVEYGPRRRSVELVLPYRPASAPGGFAIHRLKLTRVDGVDDHELDGLGAAFLRGVRRFPPGAALWRA